MTFFWSSSIFSVEKENSGPLPLKFLGTPLLGVRKSVLGRGGSVGEIWKSVSVCREVKRIVKRGVEKDVGKCVGVWGELWEDEGEVLGVWKSVVEVSSQVSVWSAKKRWRRCGEVLGEVWERCKVSVGCVKKRTCGGVGKCWGRHEKVWKRCREVCWVEMRGNMGRGVGKCW